MADFERLFEILYSLSDELNSFLISANFDNVKLGNVY